MIVLFMGSILIMFFIRTLGQILSIIFPFLLGFIVAYTVNPFIVVLEKRMPRYLAIILLLIFLVFVVCFLVFTLAPILYKQIIGFTIQLLKVLGGLSEKIQFSSSNLEVGLIQFFHQVLQRVGTFTTDTTVLVFGEVFSLLGKVALGFISFLYFLVYMGEIRKKFQKIFSRRYPRIYEYLLCLDKKMNQYVKGVFLLMFLQFVEYSLLFYIIGHPHFLVLGIFIGLFTIIPYVGGIVSSLIACLTAFMISKNLFYATLFVCLFFSVVDEYLISPKIYGKSNDIHPLLTIFLFSLGGSLGGVLGIILAIPIYVFIKTTVFFFLDDAKSGIQYMKNSL